MLPPFVVTAPAFKLPLSELELAQFRVGQRLLPFKFGWWLSRPDYTITPTRAPVPMEQSSNLTNQRAVLARLPSGPQVVVPGREWDSGLRLSW